MKPFAKPPQKYLIEPEPVAPLSTWNHYRIVKKIERKVQIYLHDQGYEGYCLGIRVGYSVYQGESEEPQSQSLSFGYVTEADDKTDTWLNHYKNSVRDLNPPETDNPLTDDFIDELYTEAANLIKANIDPSVETFTVLLETAVSGSVKKKGRDCRRPRGTECNQACTGRRVLRQRNNGTWFCTHQVCN